MFGVAFRNGEKSQATQHIYLLCPRVIARFWFRVAKQILLCEQLILPPYNLIPFFLK